MAKQNIDYSEHYKIVNDINIIASMPNLSKKNSKKVTSQTSKIHSDKTSIELKNMYGSITNDRQPELEPPFKPVPCPADGVRGFKGFFKDTQNIKKFREMIQD